MTSDRIIVKSVKLEPATPYAFAGRRQSGRAVWTVTFHGQERRIVTTYQRGLQERGLD